MLSRIADSMFWLDRYMERSEELLRTIRTAFILSLDRGPALLNGWKQILDLYSDVNESEKNKLLQDNEAMLSYLILDRKNTNSLLFLLTRARENARGMQDYITKEVWEQVNYMYHAITQDQIKKRMENNQPLDSVDYLLKECLLYTGICDSTMPRGMSWCFMNLGKYLERAIFTIQLTLYQFELRQYKLVDDTDIIYWRSLLYSLSGYEFFLKTYRSNTVSQNVIHQVILQPQFPHSVLYALKRIENYLEQVIEDNNPGDDRSGLQRQFGRIVNQVECADIDYIAQEGLKPYLIRLSEQLFEFNSSLNKSFFLYS